MTESANDNVHPGIMIGLQCLRFIDEATYVDPAAYTDCPGLVGSCDLVDSASPIRRDD